MIDHRPCVTNGEIARRIVEDQRSIQKLLHQGYEIRTMLSYSSDMTGETHCLPVFVKDSLFDIVNRYGDFFPRELQDTLDAASRIRQHLDSPDAMNKSRTMMASFKIPLGLYKMLEVWMPGFWAVESGTWKNRKLIRRLMNYISKCKIHA